MIVFFLVLIVLTISFSYQSHISQACRAIGIRISPPEFLEMNKNGFQDGLSDPKDNIPFFISLILCLILLIISFIYFSVKVGFLSIIIFFLIFSISKILFPKYESSFFVFRAYNSIIRRHADYTRDGDKLRADAAEFLKKLIEEHYF